MNVTVTPSETAGYIKAIASKSAAHRLLICAAFADAPTVIRCEEINEDICATVRCLEALGATVTREGDCFRVVPIQTPTQSPRLACGESGSTLRFLVPVVCMLGVNASFWMEGRLPQRPLSPLREELEQGGILFSPIGANPLTCHGMLNTTDFTIPGNVSSQFISGLLFALAVSGKTGSIRIEGTLESTPYITLTVRALRQFGIAVTQTDSLLEIRENRGLHSPAEVCVEGDWSNAAFPLCLGAVGRHPITVTGLDLRSCQGDRAIVSLLRQFGAMVQESGDAVTVSPAPLHGIAIDAGQIPDLVPILATVASVAQGTTEIFHAARLRIKESDRLQTVRSFLTTLGADVTETADGLTVRGSEHLNGGTVSSFGDHRIAMSAAIASAVCCAPVTVEQAQAVAKSYPAFWEDMERLGMAVVRL